MEIVGPTHISGWRTAKAVERRGDAAQRQMAVLDKTRLTGGVTLFSKTTRKNRRPAPAKGA